MSASARAQPVEASQDEMREEAAMETVITAAIRQRTTENNAFREASEKLSRMTTSGLAQASTVRHYQFGLKMLEAVISEGALVPDTQERRQKRPRNDDPLHAPETSAAVTCDVSARVHAAHGGPGAHTTTPPGVPPQHSTSLEQSLLALLPEAVLAGILIRAAAAAPDGLGPLLRVSKLFRDTLLRAATHVTVTHDHPALLRLCAPRPGHPPPRLRSMTVSGCMRLPWSVVGAAGAVCTCSPSSVAHLSALTRVAVTDCAVICASELDKLRALPALSDLRWLAPCDAAALQRLAALTALTSIEIECTLTVPSGDLAPLSHLLSLRRLTLAYPTAAIAGLTCLSSLAALQHLQLDALTTAGPQSIQLEWFAPLTALTYLASSMSDDAKSWRYGDAPAFSVHNRVAAYAGLRSLQRLDGKVRFQTPNDRSLWSVLTSLTHFKWSTEARLQANHHRAADAELSHLARTTSLRHVDLYGSDISTTRCLRALRQLTFLSLSGCTRLQGHPEELSVLRDMTRLQQLNVNHLFGKDGAAAALEHVSQLVSLRTLTLEEGFDVLSDDALACLSRLSALQSLNLHNANVTEAGMVHVAGLVGLTALRLRLANLDGCLQHVRGLTSLRQLTCLSTDVCLTDDGLVHLSVLTALELLDVGQWVSSDSGLQCLAGLSRLETVIVNGYSFEGRPQPRCWSRWPKLRMLVLEKCGEEGQPSGDANLVKALGRLSSLRLLESLQLDSCTCRLENVTGLDNLSTLTFLMLRDQPDQEDQVSFVSNSTLAFVAKMTSLVSLSICECDAVTDLGVAMLKHLTRLTWLEVKCRAISPATLGELQVVLRLSKFPGSRYINRMDDYSPPPMGGDDDDDDDESDED